MIPDCWGTAGGITSTRVVTPIGAVKLSTTRAQQRSVTSLDNKVVSGARSQSIRGERSSIYAVLAIAVTILGPAHLVETVARGGGPVHNDASGSRGRANEPGHRGRREGLRRRKRHRFAPNITVLDVTVHSAHSIPVGTARLKAQIGESIDHCYESPGVGWGLALDCNRIRTVEGMLPINRDSAWGDRAKKSD